MMARLTLRFTLVLLGLQLLSDAACAANNDKLRIRNLDEENQIVDDLPSLVGGEKANTTLYPFFVHFTNGDCAGTLISPTRVLTAAHCVQSGHPASVRIGATDRTSGEEVQVRCAKTHPLYDWPNYQYDIAVLKLDEPYTKDITYPQLNPFVGYPSVEGQPLTVVGLGRTETTGPMADYLVELKYNLVSDSTCKAAYGDEVSDGLHLCAEGIRKGTCFGDAGGPLFDDFEDRFMVGVVTGASGGCGDNKVADVYADVAAFYDWIVAEETDDTCDRTCVGFCCDAFEYLERVSANTFGFITGFFSD